jgi:hypothetical protein
MTDPNEKPKKSKRQLKRSAIYSLLIALMIVSFPALYALEYRKQGFIYTGKTHIVTATGDEALLIIYGTAAAAVFAALIAIYNTVNCLIKIRRGDFSAEDQSPEFVICKNCKTPQYSKDLINGRCAKCSGIVVNIEGYYKHHPKKHQGEKSRSQVMSQFKTCSVCGKTYYREDCAESICEDCKSLQ